MMKLIFLSVLLLPLFGSGQKMAASVDVGLLKLKDVDNAFEANIAIGGQFSKGGFLGGGLGVTKFKNTSIAIPTYFKMFIYNDKGKLSPLGNAQLGYMFVSRGNVNADITNGGFFGKIGFGMIGSGKTAPYILANFTIADLTSKAGGDKGHTGFSFAAGIKF